MTGRSSKSYLQNRDQIERFFRVNPGSMASTRLSESAIGTLLSDTRPYKPWAGVWYGIVTQDLACNHTMAETSGANVE
jgi:hypothetical protein